MPLPPPSCKSLFTYRKLISLLVAAALITSSLLSSVVVLNPQFFAKNAGWLTGEKVLICTSEGLKWFSASSLERHNNHQDHSEHSGFNTHCPIFKLHDGKGFSFDGAYNFVGFIQFVGHIGHIQSQHHAVTSKLYRIAPKHSPPISIIFS